MNIKILSVNEVNNYLKRIIDNDFILSNLSVKGEISNLKYHSSGHIYFTLKDSSSKINCVMFKGRAMFLNFKLEEGISVVVKGRVSVYPASGNVQIYCDEIEREGQGKLYIMFEKLKEKLNNEGYFDEENKKAIPRYPNRIGIVTSETGAAIRDIINVSRRRNKMVDLVLYPAQVQGEGAYKDVIKGIEYFNKSNSVDVIIIGRGGGSIEELWNFNEEKLAMAIFKSKIPIISAVGHEVDYTISDFVSDMRAATPSQAAEIAVPLEEEMKNNILLAKQRMENIIQNIFEVEKARIDSLSKMLKLNSPMIKIVNCYSEVDNLKNLLNKNIMMKIDIEKQKLDKYNRLLIANNPVKLIGKGYAIIEDNDGIISSKDKLKQEKEINITFKDGKVTGNFSPK